MDRIEETLEYLKGLHKQKNREWISVKDVLPKSDGFVICCKENGVLVYGCWFSRLTLTWYGYGSAQQETNITHWMPFPDAPKL